MQKIIILIAILIGTILVVNAQENKETGVYFGAIMGIKYNDFNKHFI